MNKLTTRRRFISRSKVRVIALAVGVCAIALVWMAVLLFGCVALFDDPRPDAARELMASFSSSDWSDLYHEGRAAYEEFGPVPEPVPQAYWPEQIVQLAPPVVWLQKEYVFLKWTGGHSEDMLWVYLVFSDGTNIIGGPESGASQGVWVIDGSGLIPLNPYSHREP